jgi:hypothetical protein
VDPFGESAAVPGVVGVGDDVEVGVDVGVDGAVPDNKGPLALERHHCMSAAVLLSFRAANAPIFSWLFDQYTTPMRFFVWFVVSPRADVQTKAPATCPCWL